MTDRYRGAAAAVGTGLLLVAPAQGQDTGGGPWPAPVPGWVAPGPGEHPRLFFRRADLPALRARARTPEGKQLIERTVFLLDGADHVRAGKSFTLFDAAAFGFVYQMTGDRKYADLAKQSQDKFWTPGTLDKDDRYSLVPPNEPMRAGPSLYAVALAYDLCYDAWTPEYRKEQAQKILTWKGRCKKRGGEVSTESMARRADNPNPVSNHYGLQVGGAGLALLALGEDPELTPEQRAQVKEWYEAGIFRQARKVFTEDFGATGYFAEHGGPGVLAMSWTMTPWIRAERVAGGRDWLTNPKYPNPEWMSLQFVLKTIAYNGVPMYANPVPGRGGYGGDVLEQNGGHHAGYFSQGFGAVRDSRKPALLWVYQTFVEPYERRQYKDAFPTPTARSFDTFNYPHRPMYAFLNWPLGAAAENPEATIPKAAGDLRYGQFVFRNRWRDANDTLVCITFGARTADREARRSMVWGLGQQMTFGAVVPVTTGNGKVGQAVIDAWQPAEDGSGVVSAGGTTFQVLTLSPDGKHPAAKAEGNKVAIGAQTISFDGKSIVFGKLAGPPKLQM